MNTKILIHSCLCLAFLLLIPGLNAQEEEKSEVKIGGSLRFNYNLSNWKPEQQKRGGDFGFDLFRINAIAKYKKIILNAEYRQYSEGFGGGMLKQGWLEYKPSEKATIHLGLTQVPFGIQKYNSHNWFFNLPYYVGLEDDHDMGIKYIHQGERYQLQIAFFKNAEELNFGNTSDISYRRYSYDVSGRNKETNQGNFKWSYLAGADKSSNISISLMYGGLYNRITQKMGSHYAAALSYELNKGPFNLKLQSLIYKKAVNDSSQYENYIEMAAYNYPYQVAAQAMVHTLGIAYSIPVSWGPVSSLQLYNDFGIMQKAEDSFHDTYMNVLGCLLTAGNVYTYVDAAFGKNNPWLGPDWTVGLSLGNPNAEWHMRFNINIGYYF